MSNNVDNRIVSMEFDNSNFERNVKTSMNTLDKLDEKLKFEGAEDGFRNLEQASGRIDFSALQNSIQNIEKAFTPMGIAFRNVWDDVIDYVEGKIKYFNQLVFQDPYKDGFKEYELKMSSVQTIMASTRRPLEDVNKQLEELNKYSDRTIYSFADMTNNIGKFTNAGIELEDAVAAIKGISNEAALSGANANEASRAMYNFSQALSSGSVKLIDWNSIANANMATKEFKQELLDTAVAMGTLSKQSNGYVPVMGDIIAENAEGFDAVYRFNDSLSDGWLTSEVLIETLKRYTDETTDLGQRAYAAATEVKTFTMMMETLKESMGSGWSQTFELIIGDFEEAKEMFTKLTGIFDNMINITSTVRNNLIKIWDASGGREKLLNNIYAKLDKIESKYNTFMKTILGNNYEKLIGDIKTGNDEVTESIEAMTDAEKQFAWEVWNSGLHGNGEQRQKEAEELGLRYDVIQEYINGIANGTNTWNSYQESLNETTEEVKENVEEAVEAVKDISNGKVSKFLKDVFETGKNIGKTIYNIGAGLANIGGIFVKSLIKTLDYDKVSGGVRDFSEGILIASEAFRHWTENTKVLGKIFDTVFSSINVVIGVIGNVYKVVRGIFSYIYDNIPTIRDGISNAMKKISSNSKLKAFWNTIKNIFASLKNEIAIIKDYLDIAFAVGPVHGMITAFEKLGEVAKKLVGGALGFIRNLFSGTSKDAENAGGALNKSANNMSEGAKALNILKDILVSVFNIAKRVVLIVGPKIADFLSMIAERIKNMTFDDVVNVIKQGGLLALLYHIIGIVKNFKNLGGGLAKTIKNVGYALAEAIQAQAGTDTASKLLKFAKAIAIFTACIFALALINPDRLNFVLEKVRIGLVALLAVMYLMDRLNNRGGTQNSYNNYYDFDIFRGLEQGAKLTGIAAVITSFTLALIGIATALKILESVGIDKFDQKFAVMMTMFALMVAGIAAIIAVSKKAENSIKSYMGIAFIIKSMSSAIRSITLSLVLLSLVISKANDEGESLEEAFIFISVLLMEFVAVLYAASKINNTDGNALSYVPKLIKKLANAMLIIAIAMAIVSLNDMEENKEIFAGFAILIGEILGLVSVIVGLSAIANNIEEIPKIFKSITLMIIAIAAAIFILGKTDGDIEEASKWLIGIVGVLTVMGIMFNLTAGSTKGAKGMLAAAVAILAISYSLKILLEAIDKLDDPDSLSNTMLSLIGLLVVIAAITSALGVLPTSIAGAGAFVVIASGVLILSKAIDILAKNDMNKVSKGLNSLVTSFAKFLGFAALFGIVSPLLTKFGASLIILSKGFLTLSIAFAIGCAAISLVLVALKALLEIFAAAGDGSDEFVSKMKASMNALYDAASFVAKILLKIIDAFLEGLEEVLPGIVAKVVILLLEVIAILDTYIYPLAKALLLVIVNLINYLALLVAEEGSMLLDALMNVILALVALVLEGIQAGLKLLNYGGWADGFIGMLEDSQDEIIDSITKSTNLVSAAMNDNAKDVKQATKELGSAFDLEGAFGNTKQYSLDPSKFIDTKSLKSFGNNLNIGPLSAEDMMKGFDGDYVQKSLDKYMAPRPNTLTDTYELMGKNNASAYLSPFDSFDVESVGYDFSEEGLFGMEEVTPMYEMVGEDQASILSEEFEASSPQTYYEGQLMSEDGAQGISDEKWRYEEAANNVVSAFIDGLKRQGTNMWGAGRDMAISVLTGFDTVLHLSTIGNGNDFYDRGILIGDNLVAGLSDAAYNVNGDATNIANELTNAIDDSLDDYNPTITANVEPIFDSDAYEKAKKEAQEARMPADATFGEMILTGNWGEAWNSLFTKKYTWSDDLSNIANSLKQTEVHPMTTAELVTALNQARYADIPDDQLNSMAERVAKLQGQRLGDVKIVLDSGEFVGAMVGPMNDALGEISRRNNMSIRGSTVYKK